MPDFSTPSTEAFQILQSFDYTVMLYGKDGNRVEDPGEARRMFAKPENLLVSLIEDGDSSTLRLFIGNKTNINDILGLLLSLRTAASKYNLLFNVRQYGREISPKDFAGETIEESARKDHRNMDICEGMYGTSRSSYLRLENARMIVRHSGKVDETKIGARSRCVESILVENAAGERMLFPTNNLSAGRAMAQHVNMGGGFRDTVGEQITEMAKDYGNLTACNQYINNTPVTEGEEISEGVQAIREKCRTKMREMKKVFERMYRSANGYQTESKKLEDRARMLNENADGIAPEKIEEVRKTLNLEGSSILSDAVFETVCKLCDDAPLAEDAEDDIEADAPRTQKDFQHKSKADAMAAQAERKRKADLSARKAQGADKGMRYKDGVVSVMGGMANVHRSAWDKLKAGEIDLFGVPPKVDDYRFPSKVAEVFVRFQNIVPLVQDDTLMNLFSAVTSRFETETDPQLRKQMVILMRHVVQVKQVVADKNTAGDSAMDEGISVKNKVIREFSTWIKQFSTEVALCEDIHHPWDDTSHIEDAVVKADMGFTVDEFMDTKWGTFEEEEIPVESVKSSLKRYFQEWMESYLQDSFWSEHDLDSLAENHTAEVVAELSRQGHVVIGGELAEDAWDGDLTDEDHRSVLDDCMVDEELTREDVLLPSPNEGESLAREVTPRTVRDPDTGKDIKPDSSYISRLRTRAGLSTQARQYF